MRTERREERAKRRQVQERGVGGTKSQENQENTRPEWQAYTEMRN